MTTTSVLDLPDITLSARELFKIDSDLQVPAFSTADDHVPPLDPDYVFDRDTTLALLAGFMHNRRVMVQGRHGTGKSSHVEQVAARLNWPCVRVNLDGHDVSRFYTNATRIASIDDLGPALSNTLVALLAS